MSGLTGSIYWAYIGILGQMWYLIVSIPDLCTLTYLTLSLHRSALFGLSVTFPCHIHASFERKHEPLYIIYIEVNTDCYCKYVHLIL